MTDTATAQALHRYNSPYPQLRLVMVPDDEEYREFAKGRGGWRKTEGRHIQFGEPDFSPGYYETNDPEVIEFLAEHVNRDRLFFDVTGQIPKPDYGDVMEEVVRATAGNDVDKLVELYEAERTGHQRPQVTKAIEAALGRLEEEAGQPQEAG